MTEPYKDLYESALDTIALLAGQLRDAELMLEREQEQHLDKCAELEKYKTLADYRQGKLERREGVADRRGAWAFSTVEHHPDTRVAQRRVS